MQPGMMAGRGLNMANNLNKKDYFVIFSTICLVVYISLERINAYWPCWHITSYYCKVQGEAGKTLRGEAKNDPSSFILSFLQCASKGDY